MDISPDFGAVGGIGDLRLIVGALLTYVLIFAVLMLVVSAVVWGIATSSGNYQLALRARTAVLVAVGAAALAGAAVTLMNFFLDVGETL